MSFFFFLNEFIMILVSFECLGSFIFNVNFIVSCVVGSGFKSWFDKCYVWSFFI